ncbi:hypothetical protein C8J57DRAFT_1514177 [Mycena rebaudengoi]|nr:hypothetical protein C8J57DRAFT_1514177 [Mycena rebaudengoi]
MSSPSPKKSSNDTMEDIWEAMQQSSPVRPAASKKRARSKAGSDNEVDGEHEKDADDHKKDADNDHPATGSVNPNIAGVLMNYAQRKRLRPEQKEEVKDFLTDPPSLREAKAFVQTFHLTNMINKIIKNMYSYAAAILLSAKLAAYKGSMPKTILYAILKKHRFDLPPGIEHNPAEWGKVIKAVQYVFTQLRSTFKKMIGKSYYSNVKKKTISKKSKRKSIFELTQSLVEGTQCEVNVVLCARVAFMRRSFIVDSSPTFWDTVDRDLAKIRTESKGDANKILRAFRHILKKDRADHGTDDYQLEETVDTFQQDVDEVVEATALAKKEEDNESEEEGEEDEE